MLALSEILTHFAPATRVGPDKYRTICPVHGGGSLVISQGETSILFKCWAHDCPLAAVLDAAHLTMGDISPSALPPDPIYRAIHDYRDLAGVLRYQVVQLPTPPGAKKKFRQRRPGRNGAGEWIWNLQGMARLPFRWPELRGHARIWIAEGEKDVNRLWSLGLPATCNSGGTGEGWSEALSACLVDVGVDRAVVVQDRDAPGAAHAVAVAQSLERAGIRALVLPPFPDVPDTGGDISDWLDLGHTVAELDALILAQPPAPAPHAPVPPDALDATFLTDGVLVVQEGQRIAADGIRYVVEGLIPAYGTLGMLVAYAKVGKTTFAQGLAAAVAMGQPFLERATVAGRVLVIAAEDPPEYTAYLARTLVITPDRLTFYRAPIQLNADGLRRIVGTVTTGGYTLVLLASWQAVVASLVKDENDNAGAVRVAEQVKAATRLTHIPWLADAHAGKHEDQTDGADPSRAMRGASALAAAADYALWLRYAAGAFASTRKLSGKGRFVHFPELTLDYDATTGALTLLGDPSRVQAETTWHLLCQTGALTLTPQTTSAIARAAGLVPEEAKPTQAQRRLIRLALRDRPTVGKQDALVGGWKTTLYYLLEDAPDIG